MEQPSLARHGLWVFVGRLANVAIAALSTFVVARMLPQAEFGRFSAILAATQLIALIGIFGLDQAVLREMGKTFAAGDTKKFRPLLRSFAKLSACAQLASAVTAALLLYFFGPTLVKEPVTLLALAATVLFTMTRAAVQTAGETARALDDPLAANLLGGNAGGALGTAGFLALLYFACQYGNVDWGTAIALYVAASVVPLLIILFRISQSWRRFPEPVRHKETGATPGELARRAALPLFLISVVTFASSRADVLLLSFFKGPEEVAIYEAARRLTLLLTIPLGLMNMVVVTSISRLYAAGQKAELQRILQTASALAAIPCVILCGLFLVIPELILRVCFGEEYVVSAPILRILVPGQLVFVLSGTCSLTLTQTGHMSTRLWISLLSSMIILIAGPFVINWSGTVGLAIVMSIAIGADNAISSWVAYSLVGVKTYPGIPSRLIRLRG